MSSSPFHGIFSSFGQDDVQMADLDTQVSTMPEATTPAQNPPGSQQGQIAVDIYEHDTYYIIRAPIAGVRLSDIDIEVDEKNLVIRGMRRPHEDIPEDQYYLQECFWGEFSRKITLPCIIDPKKVKATFSKDSILKIVIPKEEKIKVVRINEGG